MKLSGGTILRSVAGSFLVLLFVFALSAPARAQLVVNTPFVDFGNQAVGTQTEFPLLAEITNTSERSTYTVTDISSSLSEFAYFASGSFTIAPGGVLDLWVWFTPSSAQFYSGAITFRVYDAGSIQIGLVGNGISGRQSEAALVQGTLTASSSSVDFGSVGVGGNGSRGISVTNSGSANVTFSNVSVSGAGVDVFGFSDGQVLQPGQTAPGFVIFTPAASGSVTGSVTISSDASNSQLVISVSGSGLEPTIAVHSVALTWDPSVSDGVIGYNIYRSPTPGGYYSLLTLSVNPSTNYVDASVQSGQTYYYVVTAIDSNEESSSYSSEISASVP